ncbi:MAG: hypothetical protein HEQ39_10080 [Rhizobacter sp.]
MAAEIWAGGVRDTALNNIRAAITQRILEQSDGSKVLDTTSVLRWINDQVALMRDSGDIADLVRGKETVNLLIGMAQTVHQPAVTTLANTVRKERWIDDPRWPKAQGQSAAEIISTLKQQLSEVRGASEAITRAHKKMVDEAALAKFTQAFVEREGLKFTLPPAVTRIVDDRYYIYTYVTDWDEESAPSPPSERIEVDQNDSVAVSTTAPPGGRHINRFRLYRSNVGSVSAGFQFVEELPINQATYTDEKKSSELQEICPSLAWAEPPSALKGLVGMPNGVIAGFVGNSVSFCETNYQYAWPVEYRHSTENPIVAMAAFGQTLVVGTQGVPYYISGADSASMSAQKMQSNQACVSRRSMCAVDGGVVYASPDGLCLADASGIRVVTAAQPPRDALFTREDWQKLQPESIVAAYHERTYFWLWNNGTESGCYALHMDSGKLVTLDLEADALYVDKLTDTLYAARGSYIYAIFSGGQPRTGVWRSKVSVHAKQAGYAWLQVESDFEYPVVVRWFGDGVLRYTVTVLTRAPVRLPPGRWLEHEIEVQSQGRWTAIVLASSTAELQSL